MFLIVYYFCLPNQLFKDPTSTVITSSNNELLGAQIANDGQWRFPDNDSVFQKSLKRVLFSLKTNIFINTQDLTQFQYYKALRDNIKSGKVKRGGSTITQQVIRLIKKRHTNELI